MFDVVKPVELKESLGNSEHSLSPQDVEVEVEALVIFVINRLPVCEGDGPQAPL